MLTPGHDDAAVNLLYNPYQQAFLQARRERLSDGRRTYHRLSLFSGRRGGKALWIETPIPTPNGWVTMGDLREGDEVFTADGTDTRVSYVSPVYWDHDCYRVSFSGGTSIVADADHQWQARSVGAQEGTIVTTVEMAAKPTYSVGSLNGTVDVVSIEPVPSVPVCCIQVEHPSALYVAGEGCIVTHNTRIGALAALEEMTVPGTVGWMCAPTYPKLHDYVMPAFFAVLPKSWYSPGDYSAEHKTIKLANGSMAAFRSLDSPDAGRGPGLHWAWIDEVCEVQEPAWHALRPALTEHRGVAWFTSSPRGYDWAYRTFWRPAAEGVPGFWACKYKTAENPIIDPAEVEEARLTLPPKVFQQEYEADFVTFEGAIYDNALLDPCILRTDAQIRRFLPEWPQIDASRAVLVGLDPGADHPFAGVVLLRTEAGLVAVAEYLERQLPAATHVANLRRLVSPFTDIRWAVDKTQRQMMIELATHHLYAIPAVNDQVAGINRVWSWMQTQRLGLIESRVPRLIGQMRSLVWDDATNKDGQKRRQQQKKVDDDLADACRYAIASWPDLPKPPDPDTARPLHTVPADQRWAWERERRLNKPDDGLRPVALYPLGSMYD